jgi:cysteine-rich repeat protein
MFHPSRALAILLAGLTGAACLDAATESPDAGLPAPPDATADGASGDGGSDGPSDGGAEGAIPDTARPLPDVPRADIDAENPAPLGTLIVNEVAPAGEPTDWFEIYNNSDRVIDLEGWSFSDRLDNPRYTPFPEGAVVEPGAWYVVRFDDTYPGYGLGRQDEFALYDPERNLVDFTAWVEGDAPAGRSWGRIPDGLGDFRQTLPTPGAANEAAPDPEPEPVAACGNGEVERGEACDDSNQVDGDGCSAGCAIEAGWTCAAGSPSVCQQVTGPRARVVINEVKARPFGDDANDWLELINLESTPADISGWTFQDDNPENLYTFPAGTVIPPGGFLVLDEGTDFTFGLGRTDAAVLRDTAGDVVDETAWEDPQAEGGTWGRLPDGTGTFQTLTQPTRGAPNRMATAPECGNGRVEGEEACDDGNREAGDGCSMGCSVEAGWTCTGTAPSVCSRLPAGTPRVVINEAKAQPLGDDADDWVEFLNAGEAPAVLTGWTFRDDNDANIYAFPEGTTVAPGAFLVIVQGADFSFGLGRDDAARLFDASGTLVDSTSWVRPAADNGTWGRLPDGTGAFRSLGVPTRGAPNRAE